jgi:NAD(P)H dehydrogenase (quinone)
MTENTNKKPRVLVLYYSTWGHVRQLAVEEAKGLKEAGCDVDIRQVKETLPEEVLKKMYAVPQSKFEKEHPIMDVKDLGNYDGYLFGVPTRFGMMPAQFKAFWDATGGYWKSGGLVGRPAGIFFSTASLGGGQETTALTFLTQLTHHGMVYVPIGYSSPNLLNLKEIHGGSPYGAGTLSDGDGSRQPSQLEKDTASHQGKLFGTFALQLHKGRNS